MLLKAKMDAEQEPSKPGRGGGASLLGTLSQVPLHQHFK